MAHTMLSGVREVLTLAQLGEFVDCHHTVDLFRLETLPIYNADSDDDGPWWAARPADHRDTEAG